MIASGQGVNMVQPKKLLQPFHTPINACASLKLFNKSIFVIGGSLQTTGPELFACYWDNAV